MDESRRTMGLCDPDGAGGGPDPGGKGLAVDQLRKQTGGAEARDEEMAEAIFASGISTVEQVSQVAGRGVGMDLIRSSVRKLRGDVKIGFTAEPARGYRAFELVFSLPATAAHA